MMSAVKTKRNTFKSNMMRNSGHSANSRYRPLEGNLPTTKAVCSPFDISEIGLIKNSFLQPRLKINTAGDKYEQEADRIAEQIMSMPESQVQRSKQHVGRYTTVRRKSDGETGPGLSAAISQSRGGGQPLDRFTSEYMSSRLGRDLSDVRVHTGSKSVRMNEKINSRAFTVGRDIYFNQGQYSPGTSEGKRLLAHELTHVLQQQQSSTSAPSVLMRKPGDKEKQPTKAASFDQKLFVVRDSSIGLGGGTLVSDLDDFKKQVMGQQNTGPWTLVLAIHGSLDRVAAQAPPNWQKDAVFYKAKDIIKLFNKDPKWVQWRDKYGPSHIALVACQVSLDFEKVMINNLARHVKQKGASKASPTQTARGMGSHCKPLSSSSTYTNPSGDSVTKRKDYKKLSASLKSEMKSEFAKLNKEYGYYGAPPVPDSKILDYYFDEAPKGSWAIVTVGKDENGVLKDTDIPYWNRTTGPKSSDFRRKCDQGMGILKGRRPRVPSTP